MAIDHGCYTCSGWSSCLRGHTAQTHWAKQDGPAAARFAVGKMTASKGLVRIQMLVWCRVLQNIIMYDIQICIIMYMKYIYIYN
jgi:hypothetical protein